MIALLHDYCEVLIKSLETLQQSFEKCKTYNIAESNLSMDQSDALDALTSKFARTSDLYTQKILNNILRLKRSDANTYVDKMNNCEKASIIISADQLIAIRDLRNEIAHEYWMEQLREQQQLTIELLPPLFANIKHTISYIDLNIGVS